MPYTAAHIVTQLQLLLFAGLAFFALRPYIKNSLTITLDWDWFYRRLFAIGVKEAADKTATAHGDVFADSDKRFRQVIDFLKIHHGEDGIFARTWPSGSMALWAAVMLGGFVLIYYA